MDAEQLKQFKQQLLELNTSLKQQLDDQADAGLPVELDQSKVGRLSRMDAIQQQQMAKEATRRLELQLVRTDSALARIETGEFGFCLNCDDAINVKRLEFDPSSLYCITCAEKLSPS